MSQSDVQRRLFRAVLLVGATLAAVCIAGNAISGFPLETDLKWIALFAITVTAHVLSSREKYAEAVKFCVFLFLIFAFLPFAFIDSGGSNNNAIGYAFLLLIVEAYLFSGWKRNFLAVSLIVTFAAMRAVEYYFPQLITQYPDEAQFIDRMIQIPLLMTASFLLVLWFAKEYERVNRKLDTLAKYDELTGLNNRRMFDKAVDEAFRPGAGPVYLALLDLNNFKKVNDNCGHLAGDNLLKELANLLRKYFDANHHAVSRWGGDEFAIVFHGEKDDLAERIERIKAEFKTLAVAYEKSAGITTGLVSFAGYDTIAQMFLAADRQLYELKRGGKTA